MFDAQQESAACSERVYIQAPQVPPQDDMHEIFAD